jgi:hypothetical protein
MFLTTSLIRNTQQQQQNVWYECWKKNRGFCESKSVKKQPVKFTDTLAVVVVSAKQKARALTLFKLA